MKELLEAEKMFQMDSWAYRDYIVAERCVFGYSGDHAKQRKTQ